MISSVRILSQLTEKSISVRIGTVETDSVDRYCFLQGHLGPRALWLINIYRTDGTYKARCFVSIFGRMIPMRTTYI